MAETRMRKWRLGPKWLGVEFDAKGRVRGQFLLWERLGSSRVQRRKAKAARLKKRATLKAAQAKAKARQREIEKKAVAAAVAAQSKGLPQGKQVLTGTVLAAGQPRPAGHVQGMQTAGLCGAVTTGGARCMNRGNCPHHPQGSRRP